MNSGNWRRLGLAVAFFFALKMALGAALLIASARWMRVDSFAVFSQLLVFIAYLSTIGTAGVQNGLIRQIAAARGDVTTIAGEVRAAVAIWLAVAATAVIACWLLDTRIAVLLSGLRNIAWILPWLALSTIFSGLGQLFCSVLTGTGRAGAALLAQGIGLVIGTASALILLHDGNPLIAALAFSIGQTITTVVAGVWTTPILGRALRTELHIGPEVRRLLTYSGTFLLVASILPLTLLGLRSIYRTAAGLEALGFWLAANRISDVNTQLLGLYMVQVFLPGMAGLKDKASAWPLVRQTFVIGSLAMGACLAVFLTMPNLLIVLFLSAKFLPALPIMLGYFVGDTLRVSSSIASYSALARRRLAAYVGFEAAAALLLASILILLIHFGATEAPALAYASTYALMIIPAWWFIVRLLRRGQETNVANLDLAE